MRKYKILLCLLCGLSFAAILSGKPFIIGIYSYLHGSGEMWEASDTLSAIMQKLGYNTTVCETKTGDRKLGEVLGKLDQHDLDVIVIDTNIPEYRPEQITSLHNLALSNYGHFTAGQFVKTALQGKSFKLTLSNDLLGNEFQFIKPYLPEKANYYLDSTFVYFTYAFKIDKLKRNPSKKNILTFELKGLPDKAEIPVPYTYKANQPAAYKFVANRKNHLDKLKKDASGNRLITFKVRLRDLLNLKLMKDEENRYGLVNLTPQLTWKGKGKFRFAYLEVEDDIHRTLRKAAPDFVKRLKDRVSDLQKAAPGGRLKYLYAFDEPNLGQFDSYRLLANLLRNSAPPLCTASYDRKRDMKTADGAFYDHPARFLAEVKPEVFMPDLFPIHPYLEWNNSGKKDFVQTILDTQVLDKYEKYKLLILDSAAQGYPIEFLPVVQAFGRYNPNGSNWGNWSKPPYETQKSLRLLPLCYGVDGVMDFILQSWHTQKNSGSDYAPIDIYDKGKGFEYRRGNLYRAVLETNRKLAVYGNLLQNLFWKDACCLKSDSEPDNLNLAEFGLVSFRVVSEPSDPHYQGYVQCGLYLSAKYAPSFMLVNRRANYLSSDKPENLSPEKYDNAFESAAPQLVKFVFDAEYLAEAGTHPVLFDPYDKRIYPLNEGTVEVSIGPGEGKLLQLISRP
jgi:hypothetical protein